MKKAVKCLKLKRLHRDQKLRNFFKIPCFFKNSVFLKIVWFLKIHFFSGKKIKTLLNNDGLCIMVGIKHLKINKKGVK